MNKKILQLTPNPNVAFDNHSGALLLEELVDYKFTVSQDYSNDELEEMLSKYHEGIKSLYNTEKQNMIDYNMKEYKEMYSPSDFVILLEEANYVSRAIRRVIMNTFCEEDEVDNAV